MSDDYESIISELKVVQDALKDYKKRDSSLRETLLLLMERDGVVSAKTDEASISYVSPNKSYKAKNIDNVPAIYKNEVTQIVLDKEAIHGVYLKGGEVEGIMQVVGDPSIRFYNKGRK